MIYNNSNSPMLGDIWLVDFPKENGFCLSGIHPCFVVRKYGGTVQVIPISGNNNNPHSSEIPLEKGKCNLVKDSKLKMSQFTSVSSEKFIRQTGKADKETVSKVREFILHNIVDFLQKAA